MIDWTKKIETLGGTPLRVERVLDKDKAIVSWTRNDNDETAAAVMLSYNVRNVPISPREWWLHRLPNGMHVAQESRPLLEELQCSQYGEEWIRVREMQEDK
jgi:hypothetical protein